MNKTELVTAISAKAGLSKKDTGAFLDTFVDVLGDQLKKGEKIAVPGLGVFSATVKEESTALNPRTKAKIVVPKHKVAKLKFSSVMKEKINE